MELMSHEQSRTTFKLLSRSMKQNQRSQLSSLWVAMDEEGNYTKDSTTRQIFTTKEDIHKALLKRNSHHLQQAKKTPFARGWLKKGLKWDSTGELSDTILTGEILNTKRFTKEMQLFLECIKVQDLKRLNVVKPTISLEEYTNFWKKKERIPSHRHSDYTLVIIRRQYRSRES